MIAAETSAAAAASLRARFDEPSALTVGLEEEVMLLHPETLDLEPCADDVLGAAGPDPAMKPELPASQVELLTPPAATVGEVTRVLAAARRRLTAAAEGLARPAASGYHAFAAAEGVLSRRDRHAELEARYGAVARRQLVCALQIHVAVRDADRALAVHDALRSYLPELTALAANAPFQGGTDSGLASVRPTICTMLPRQGVPPALGSWEQWAAALGWGARGGLLADRAQWWFELRPHVEHGTLEVRVPDAQATVAGVAGVAAVVHALVASLCARHEAGETLPVAPTWRIAENRWAAVRHGLDGRLADLETGEPVPTRERVAALIAGLEPAARAVGCAAELAHATRLVERNGAERQRAVAREAGVRGAVADLAERFGEDLDVFDPPATGS